MPSLPLLSLGAARSDAQRKTTEVVLQGLQRVADLHGGRLLDVGCGNGLFTAHIGERFKEVVGIDIQASNVDAFLERELPNKYSVFQMSSANIEFPDGYFDAVMSIETLEHVGELKAFGPIDHQCTDGGQLVITVPNRWFPFETHGGVIFGKRFGRLPLITYIPFLHARFAEARVFTVAALDRLFCSRGFKRERVSYLWPTFEHGGNTFQRYLRWSFPFMRVMERSPLEFFGTSIVVSYRKTA